MDFILDGYCGLYCGACRVMIETKAGKAKTSCHGCKSGQLAARHCASCRIKTCARSKGFDFCDECDAVHACEKLHQFVTDPEWPYHQGVFKNMEAIRLLGKEKWLADQEARWKCANCGTPHSWWDETCPSCEQPVASYKVDI